MLMDMAMGPYVSQVSKELFIAFLKLPTINRVLRSQAFWSLALDRAFFQAVFHCLRPAPEDAIRQATDVGHKLLHALNVPYRLGGREVHSTPSIGITLFGAEREEAEPVIRRADEALYAAKRAGRNCLRIFQPEHHNPVV